MRKGNCKLYNLFEVSIEKVINFVKTNSNDTNIFTGNGSASFSICNANIFTGNGSASFSICNAKQ